MKVQITVIDDQGNTHTGEVDLSSSEKPSGGTRFPPKSRKVTGRDAPTATQLDWTLPARAFVKRYVSTRMGGAQRFALLLAWITKGDTKDEMSIKDLRSQWAKMKALMGGEYNGAYATRAKENGWVDSQKHGVYKLRKGWQEALKS